MVTLILGGAQVERVAIDRTLVGRLPADTISDGEQMRTLPSLSSLFLQLQSLLIFPACAWAARTPTGHEPPSLLFLPLSSLPEEVRGSGTCTLTHAGCSFLLNLEGHCCLSYFWILKLDTVPNLLIIFSYHLLFRAYMAKALCARSLDT